MQNKISDCNSDQKKLFKIVDTLLGRNKEAMLPKYDSTLTMDSVMNNFFIDKIDNIRAEFPLLEANLPSLSFLSMDSIMSMCHTGLYHFDPVTDTELLKIISCMNRTTCSSDPFPTRLKFCLYLLPLGAIILAIRFTRMTSNSTFHLSVRILWNH